MSSLSLWFAKESILIKYFTLSSTITKDAFAYIGGKLGKLPNQVKETASRDIIRLLLKKYE